MLDSAPVPFQAVLWPLLGTAIILALRRILPNWLRRLVALAAALLSLAALRSLIGVAAGRSEYLWEPLNLFRMSPVLYPDDLAMMVGITLAFFTAVGVLGIRGTMPQRTTWHGLILVVLAGCLVMTMASNLLTLTAGSALVDLALVGIAVSAASVAGGADRSAWRMAMPGIASTFILFLSTLRMDTQIGTASLLAREIPAEVLVLVGVAGLLRMVIFPLHPRGLRTPENAATLVLPLGVGVFLLARVQAIDLILIEQPWLLVLGGVTLLVGGLMVWSGGFGTAAPQAPQEKSGESGGGSPGEGRSEEHAPSSMPGGWAARLAGPPESRRLPETESNGNCDTLRAAIWLGLAVHQTGYAVASVILLGASVPWSLIGLSAALGILVIWWDDRGASVRSKRVGWLEQYLEPQWAKARSYVARRVPALQRLSESLPRGASSAVPLTVGVASLIGIPFTVGALGRWRFYASLLREGRAILLLATLAADTLLVAGLWTILRAALKEAGRQRPRLSALLPMLALAVAILVLGIAPGVLTGGLSLSVTETAGVSVWGLGLLYVLPWLLGTWLARFSVKVAQYLEPVGRIVRLDWFFRAGAWVSLRLVGGIYWLGQVGEGEGWWGWALIILALGAVLLSMP
jgi:hypothetical protein